MTEAEWLEGDEPLRLWRFARERVSGRKHRSLACACARHAEWFLRLVPNAAALLEIAERFADGECTADEVHDAWERMDLFHDGVPTSWFSNGDIYFSFVSPNPQTAAMNALSWAPRDLRKGVTAERRRLNADLLRDIFGNPFRRVAFDPVWRTDTAVAVARQMYDPRDFGAMPILADALQDAGCEDEHILNHCRDTSQLHVRGCWVVDLVLGKT